jgi:DNA-directed RNA polymerase specialized sigma24 family protein
LLELEGIPQQEIATIIGIQNNALRTRLNRIKSSLTKCVNNENI